MPGGLRAIVTPAVASSHAFDADPRDHCETPIEAYRDLEPLLFFLARSLKREKRDLVIWDPFYCEGSVKVLLGRLGFETVINENSDFYAVVREGRVPPHDVLVTNPPFSGEHMPAILDFVARQNGGKPWFLLMPDFVGAKPYFTAAMGALTPLYVSPTAKPYQFSAPGRDRTGGAPLLPRASQSLLPFQVFAASFETRWFASMGAQQAPALAWWTKKFAPIAQCVVSEDAGAMPRLVEPPLRPAGDKKSWRKKLSRQRKQQQAAAGGGGSGRPDMRR